ncbi:MAG: sigma-70 family RNA polymerase sigma factor [Planctomycetes bacterium]|nr:sigma-70 family RNA polymerase sigma factor [Planctomycetota bacterium]
MTCSPSQTAKTGDLSDVRERNRSRAGTLLRTNGVASLGADAPDDATRDAGLATSLMDLFRRTADREVFDCLVALVGPQLHARIRSRLRGMGAMFDAQEILQDTIVNIYRYPDRFQASRPGAFAAWSSTIVDNAIRRQMRRQRQGVDLALSAPEVLQEQQDLGTREPCLMAQDHEECSATANAFALLLQCYLTAFKTLSDREQFVLQMVEVRAMRYAELASILAVRPEALKMIVFRARKRMFDRTAQLLGVAGTAAAVVARTPATRPLLAATA